MFAVSFDMGMFLERPEGAVDQDPDVAGGLVERRGDLPDGELVEIAHHEDLAVLVFQVAELAAEQLATGAENVGTMLGETMIGTGGVIPPPAEYWPLVCEICKANDVLVVNDEVITGFGRTGAWFGFEKWGSDPDLVTMAKGLASVFTANAAQQALGQLGDEQAVYPYLQHADWRTTLQEILGQESAPPAATTPMEPFEPAVAEPVRVMA